MKTAIRALKTGLVLLALSALTGCDDPQVYGSVGVSSGYSSYGRYGGHNGYGYNSGPRMRGSISVGGRIR